MRRIPYVMTVAILIISVIGFALGTGRKAPSNSAGALATLSSADFASHHSELNFTLSPSETMTFSLPRKDFPVQISVSTSNVDVVFNGTTYQLGPLIVGGVASYDSGQAIANIAGNTQCVGNDTCQALTFIDLPPSASDCHCTLNFFVSINRHTSQLTVAMEPSSNALQISSSQIRYAVSMYY